jgi:hypothetical protein
MRKLIIVTTALAFLSSTALAQDKAGGTTAPAAPSSDTMSKGSDMSTDKMSKKTKKSAKKSSDDTKQ